MTRAARTLRVGIVGRTGRGDYGHGLDIVWREVAGAEIVAVADEDERGRKEAAARLGIKAAYADYREMLAKEKPNIVSICPRSVDCHHDMVLACAEHGASIFLEKPLCRTLAEADRMVEACERAHVKLAIAHQTRYSPKLPVIKEILKSGQLGSLLELRGRGKEDQRGGGEDLWVLGTHIFDLMRYFGGKPGWCFARVLVGGRPAAPADVREGNEGIGPLVGERVEATFGFEGGLAAFFSSQRQAAGNPSRFGLTLCGSKGLLELVTGYLPAVKVLLDPSWSPGRSGARWQDVSSAGIDRPEPIADLNLHGGNLAIVRDLVGAIEEDRQPLGSIYEARAVTEMIIAVFASHVEGRPVPLPLVERQNPLLKASWAVS